MKATINVLAIWLVAGLLLISNSLNAQLIFQKNQFLIDKNLKLIICNQPPATIAPNTTTVTFDKTYAFYLPVSTIQVGYPYDVSVDSVYYKLYFTRLPLLNISVSNPVGNDYERGELSVADTIGSAFHSFMGIKLHGSYSRTFPKKSYHLQLWADSTGKTTQNKSFFGMRSDQTWLLLAMYNEKLRLNNKVLHDLWLKMDTLYYARQEPDAHSDVRLKYVEVFQNSAYQGIYLLAEDLDRKELALKKQTSSNAGGELYKGVGWDVGTLFSGVSPLPATPTTDWSGWEVDYPDTTNWVNLHQFTDFVVNSSDSTFKQGIAKKIRQDNFADYFIFLNLIRAEDNRGKNLYLARYDQNEPYFICPWDLDGTLGYYWDGSPRNITDDTLSNSLFDRLINNTPDFKFQAASRWFFLRKTYLSLDSLTHSIDINYTLLRTNGVYDRENLVWSGPLLSYGADELAYTKTWLSKRIDYLDAYFKHWAQAYPTIYTFSARSINNTSVLTWRVNCMAVSSFSVERSTDSLSWSTLNTSPIISNDSLPCQYNFTDNNPVAGNLYYRLKIIDTQNASLYSSVQSLNFDLPVNLFPNPASTTVQIQGNVDKVDVYSLKGALLYEKLSPSANSVDVNNLATGTYLLRVFQKNGLVSTHKILVNR